MYHAYDSMADIYASRWCSSGAVDDEFAYIKLLKEIARSDDKLLLDVGCGPAIYWPLAHAANLSYVGIDLVYSMLSAAQSYFPACALACCDSRSLPFADHSFGLAVAVNSLSHMNYSGVAASLAEIARVLAPGGAFFLSDQLASTSDSGPIIYPLMKQQVSIFPKSQAQYQELLALTGFDLMNVRTRKPKADEVANDKIMFWARLR